MTNETLYDFLARRERELLATAEHHRTCLDAAESELEHVRVCRLAVGTPASASVPAAPKTLPTGVELRADLTVLPQSQVEEPEAEEEEVGEDEPDLEPPAAGSLGRIPNVILRCLPGWMEKYPDGPTILEVAAATRLDSTDIRAAFCELREQERAVVYKGKASHALHVAPLGFVPPAPEELSSNQEKVLDYFGALRPDSDGTVTPPSSAAVHEATGVPVGSLGAAVSDLERKGKIEVVQRGTGNMQKPRYRVLSRQVLRQALDGPGGTRDATATLMGDPPPGRSALVEKLVGS